ncbi:MAG: Crp/Fnr family transcriptional regulator [Acidobacteria bacterium]|nr:Crp/Fnr family transcriptional regulator [Acidobacteriota bacterium]
MSPAPISNKILSALPQTFNRWRELMESVYLKAGTVLYEPDDEIKHVYFPNGALISLVSLSVDGASIQVGMIGCEGMVGVPVILGGVSPFRAIVNISGSALRLPRQKLEAEFQRNPALRSLLLKYTNTFLIQVAQSSICNCYHPLQERLSRWLLVARDGSRSDSFAITHELIASLLGTRRASVTVAAGLLQRAGLIRTARGEITILDRKGLEATSCECYGVVREGSRRVQAS